MQEKFKVIYFRTFRTINKDNGIWQAVRILALGRMTEK